MTYVIIMALVIPFVITQTEFSIHNYSDNKQTTTQNTTLCKQVLECFTNKRNASKNNNFKSTSVYFNNIMSYSSMRKMICCAVCCRCLPGQNHSPRSLFYHSVQLYSPVSPTICLLPSIHASLTRWHSTTYFSITSPYAAVFLKQIHL